MKIVEHRPFVLSLYPSDGMWVAQFTSGNAPEFFQVGHTPGEALAELGKMFDSAVIACNGLGNLPKRGVTHFTQMEVEA